MEPKPTLLIVDDDSAFLLVMARALGRRGFEVRTAETADEALALAAAFQPRYALVDLKLAETSGLDLVPDLAALDPDMTIVVLTGYASIATAVTAIKRGAANYLPKPASAEEVVAALGRRAPAPAEDFSPMSVERLEWEHIQSVLAEHDGNISATARALGMHRRTLQRKLAKKPKRL
jgi:two-component system response regulator RegA